MTPGFSIGNDDALIVVDLMKTFMPGGGLPVPRGDEIVPVIRKMLPFFDPKARFASVESHPHGHVAFASSYVGVSALTVLDAATVSAWDDSKIAPHALFSLKDLRGYLASVGHLILWPDHAQAGTPWGDLHPDLDRDDFEFVQVKGDYPLSHPFSCLHDEFGRWSQLALRLRGGGFRRAFVCGLALDYCVKATALEAADLGLETHVLIDATRPVTTDTGNIAALEMAAHGIDLVLSCFSRRRA